MEQYLVVWITLRAHHCGTYLAQTDAMSPTSTDNGESGGHRIALVGKMPVNDKGTAIEMGVAKRAAYLQLLADGEGLLGTDNLESAYPAALTALHGLEVDDVAKVILGLLGYES